MSKLRESLEDRPAYYEVMMVEGEAGQVEIGIYRALDGQFIQRYEGDPEWLYDLSHEIELDHGSVDRVTRLWSYEQDEWIQPPRKFVDWFKLLEWLLVDMPFNQDDSEYYEPYDEIEEATEEDDPPTKTLSDGTKLWYRDDKLHREDGPAIVWADGSEEWWVNGQLHREDGPAIIRPDGSEQWWLNGQRHREDGPAVIYASGSEEWWVNGEYQDRSNYEPYDEIEEGNAGGLGLYLRLDPLEDWDPEGLPAMVLSWGHAPEGKTGIANPKEVLFQSTTQLLDVLENIWDDYEDRTETWVYHTQAGWINATNDSTGDCWDLLIQQWHEHIGAEDYEPYDEIEEEWKKAQKTLYVKLDYFDEGFMVWFAEDSRGRDIVFAKTGNDPYEVINHAYNWYVDSRRVIGYHWDSAEGRWKDTTGLLSPWETFYWQAQQMTSGYYEPYDEIEEAMASWDQAWHVYGDFAGEWLMIVRPDQNGELHELKAWLINTGSAAEIEHDVEFYTERWPEVLNFIDSAGTLHRYQNRWALKDALVDAVAALELGGGYEPYVEIEEAAEEDDPPTEIRADGAKVWRNAAGQLHREGGPAIVGADGYQAWYHNGQLHRADGPAIIYPDGTEAWYRNGQIHREGGPAVISSSGSEEWWIDGVYQDRENYEPYVEIEEATEEKAIGCKFERDYTESPWPWLVEIYQITQDGETLLDSQKFSSPTIALDWLLAAEPAALWERGTWIYYDDSEDIRREVYLKIALTDLESRDYEPYNEIEESVEEDLPIAVCIRLIGRQISLMREDRSEIQVPWLPYLSAHWGTAELELESLCNSYPSITAVSFGTTTLYMMNSHREVIDAVLQFAFSELNDYQDYEELEEARTNLLIASIAHDGKQWVAKIDDVETGGNVNTWHSTRASDALFKLFGSGLKLVGYKNSDGAIVAASDRNKIAAELMDQAKLLGDYQAYKEIGEAAEAAQGIALLEPSFVGPNMDWFGGWTVWSGPVNLELGQIGAAQRHEFENDEEVVAWAARNGLKFLYSRVLGLLGGNEVVSFEQILRREMGRWGQPTYLPYDEIDESANLIKGALVEFHSETYATIEIRAIGDDYWETVYSGYQYFDDGDFSPIATHLASRGASQLWVDGEWVAFKDFHELYELLETLLQQQVTQKNYEPYDEIDEGTEEDDPPTEIDPDGTKIWRNAAGQLHREDGPAVIGANGTEEWWVNGKRHREDGPAVIYASGSEEWWVNGQLHREDGPAVIRANGTEQWWIDGEYQDRTNYQPYDEIDEGALRKSLASLL